MRNAELRTGRSLVAEILAHRCYHMHAKSITIRDLPNETGEELAARAARSGRSLQEYLRAQLIELARRPDAEALVGRIRQCKERTGSRLSSGSILAHRDADRK